MSLTVPFGIPATVPLLPASTLNVSIIAIAFNITALLFQAHEISQLHEIVGISESGSMVHGRCVGLVQTLDGFANSARFAIANFNNRTVTVTITVQPLSDTQPIPGGCALDFDISMMPMILYNRRRIFSDFALANANEAYNRTNRQESCDVSVSKHWFLYEMYGYFLGQKNKDDFCADVQNFGEVMGIKKHGRKICSLTSLNEPFTLTHYNYPYILNVIVTDEYGSQAYVPIVVPCSGECGYYVSPFGIVLSVLYGAVGLLLLFAGHTFFRLNCFVSGFVLVSCFSGFLVVGIENGGSNWNQDLYYLISLAFGLVGALLIGLLWDTLSSPLISVCILALANGMCLASIVSYFFFDGWELFWMQKLSHVITWACVALAVPAVLLYWTKIVGFTSASHMSFSVIGATAFTMSLSIVCNGTLHFVFIRAFQRFTVTEYIERACFMETFFPKDIAMSCMWLLLVTVGYCTQYRHCKYRAPFPPPPSKNAILAFVDAIKRCYNKLRVCIVSRRRDYCDIGGTHENNVVVVTAEN